MSDVSGSLAARLEAAAALLASGPARNGAASDETGLLHFLGYQDTDAATADSPIRMLRAAAQLRRLFQLPVPDAPGLIFFGGEADPAILDATLNGMPVGSLAGSGRDPRRAFESCVGEGIEYLSQFVRPDDQIERATATEQGRLHGTIARRFLQDVLAVCNIAPDQPIGWIPCRNIQTGERAWFPADLCLRRPAAQQDFVPPFKLSTGCAAGATADAAGLRATLELIERDAAALWWRGGRRGCSIPPDGEAGRAADALLTELRQGNNQRRTWLLDITTDLGIPAVAALSSGPDGYGFAFGLGARLTLAEAACAAIFEMCQVELGPHVVAAKRQETGDAALHETDLRHLRRTTMIDTRRCPLLEPDPGRAPAPSDIPAEPAAALRYIDARLAEHGIAAFSLDLTRPDLGVPVIRMFAPGLQLEPSKIVTGRLAAAIHQTGGGAVHTGGLSLL